MPALEHTCTTATLPAYDRALEKVQYLDRPLDVPRSMQVGVDKRNQPIFRVIDGTNLTSEDQIRFLDAYQGVLAEYPLDAIKREGSAFVGYVARAGSLPATPPTAPNP